MPSPGYLSTPLTLLCDVGNNPLKSFIGAIAVSQLIHRVVKSTHPIFRQHQLGAVCGKVISSFENAHTTTSLSRRGSERLFGSQCPNTTRSATHLGGLGDTNGGDRHSGSNGSSKPFLGFSDSFTRYKGREKKRKSADPRYMITRGIPRLNTYHIYKLGLRDEGIDQLNFHSAQLGYLKLLQMGNADPYKTKAGNKYEVKPHPSQLGGRHSNPVVTTPKIALDFSGMTQQSASHNVAPNQGTAALTTRNQQLSRSSPRSICSFKWVAIEREIHKEPSITENTQIFVGERRKSREEMSRRKLSDAIIQSQAIQSQAIQSQGAKPKAGRVLTTGTRRKHRNVAFQLIRTTSHCSLDWFLKSTAGHPVATYKTRRLTKSNDAVTHASIATHSCSPSCNTIPPATGSSILRLVILSQAQRLPDATQAQQLIFHFHQLQAAVTIKFQILPVVGYSTVDSILGEI
ncbi:hypothetical protein F511_21528 [Dorcoceras hygrometricum]|uniref:Uncharacterized protein n=1 Tax=Dorcoceras hygrometricum TaxID=472368 RepID=A0A2Z7A9J2_9LAMI|nr:hypothetical protein F511_21528 [Dorcoceras hygrometricum]